MSESWCDFLVIYEDHPADMGLLQCVLTYHGCRWDEYARTGRTKTIVDIAKYKGVVSMGGRGKVDSTWELEWLKTMVGLNRGVLGICQGAQNLVEAVNGGKYKPKRLPKKDHGITPITLTGSGEADELFRHFQGGRRVCQEHSYRFKLPDADSDCLLAESGPQAVRHQEAFRLNPRVYGVQFHPEVPSTEMGQWTRNGEPAPSRDECAAIAKAGWRFLSRWVKRVAAIKV